MVERVDAVVVKGRAARTLILVALTAGGSFTSGWFAHRPAIKLVRREIPTFACVKAVEAAARQALVVRNLHDQITGALILPQAERPPLAFYELRLSDGLDRLKPELETIYDEGTLCLKSRN